MSDQPQVLSCVLIPVNGGQLLLPNVSVAEIVDNAHPVPVEDGPAWLAGHLPWRGLSLPVVCYERANGVDQVQDDERDRIAVLNNIGEHHEQLPFLALVTRGIPRQAKVDDAALVPASDEPGPADLMLVDFEGELVRIPNLEYLEGLATEQLTS